MQNSPTTKDYPAKNLVLCPETENQEGESEVKEERLGAWVSGQLGLKSPPGLRAGASPQSGLGKGAPGLLVMRPLVVADMLCISHPLEPLGLYIQRCDKTMGKDIGVFCTKGISLCPLRTPSTFTTPPPLFQERQLMLEQ